MNAIIVLLAGATALNIFALLLVVLRAPLYRVRLYRPMVVNIGLSLAPAVALAVLAMVCAVIVAVGVPPLVLWVAIGAGGAVWLLLLPNSAYSITELNFSHRRDGDPVPLWFDIVATLALALSGVVNALLNVLVAQLAYVALQNPNAVHPFARADSWPVVGAILALVSFGVYLGRHIRFNSWDLVRPTRFARTLVAHFAAPGRVVEALGFCLLHAVLLAILYVLLVGPMAVLL